VPKILVADDNSNIQKMVGLALKDQGIDVVAVGNGEAAVRKISDVRPDLVLADVFMPVRNGYEVCQYVKTDSSLSHIPVILLVGAFDPLDEQEAQRVGADGVLKKPFIPPDPLISMVKSALQRAGGGQESSPAGKAADLVTPSGATRPTVGVTSLEAVPQSSHVATEESFVEEVPVAPAPLHIDSNTQPVAFGSLLESSTQEAEEEESFVSQPAAELLERDWNAKDEEEETEEEEEEEPVAWRPEGSGEEVPAEKSTKSKSSANDWRTGGFEQIAASKARKTWEPEEEKPELVATTPAAKAPVTEVAVTPPPQKETVPVSTNPFGGQVWPSAPTGVPSEKSSQKTATAVEDRAPAVVPEPVVPERPAAQKKVEAEKKDSWFSVSSSPWDAEIKKASQLASTWDVPSVVSEPAGPPVHAEQAVEAASAEEESVIEEAALPQSAAEAIREEAAQVADVTTRAPQVEALGGASFYSHEEASKVPETTEPLTPSMDDLVAKVLAKMSPEVLQAVTREILKPVVEAMVKEELKSKK